jgi:hypothetical protein
MIAGQMRAMKGPRRPRGVMRWNFSGLAVASLLLCVALVALWVRSCRVDDTFIFRKLFLSGRLWDLGATSVTNRQVEGQCPICGYNLTGNTSGICPECGTAITTRAST